MADPEVETALREIRERVRAEAAALSAAAPPLRAGAGDAPAVTAAGARAEAAGAGRESFAADALARLEANLATTGRAYSKLPPLVSYRRGFAARLELFIKRLISRATHWFTWEQVNFNAGAHHALGDAHAALAAHERTLAAVKSDLFAVRDELRGALGQALAAAEADRARLDEQAARLAAAEARFAAEAESLRALFEAASERLGRALAEDSERTRAEVALLRAEQSRAAQLAPQVEALRAELRGRSEALAEEQRVCFRQLSLEAGETAVSFDRARRLLEARLERLEAGRAPGGDRAEGAPGGD